MIFGMRRQVSGLAVLLYEIGFVAAWAACKTISLGGKPQQRGNRNEAGSRYLPLSVVCRLVFALAIRYKNGV
ncbi:MULTISPECIES: hypothetical protein [Neisseria]|uniref:hypothetical protein n=1 Tax=Neisseria TaxID=482 RepID=UPI00107299B2|nr:MULTISPECIES: hypothetical protein [unclassified Neisseria]MBF0804378.1 hypothetical protein [Neisseria sp. 19428wB4_WF04]TFU42858.1 hypothetical protein E4T99_08505 [Neisseria sp. WF04]